MAPAPLLAALLLLLVPLAPAVDLPTAPADPAAALDRARDILDGEARLGRTPAGWIRWAEERLALAPAAGDAPALPAAMARLYQATGVVASPADLAALDAAAAALPPATAAALAGLVAATAEATAAQRALLPALDLAALAREEPVWPAPAAEASLANAERLLGAVGAYRAAVAALPAADLVAFTDPLGLVVQGGPGADVFQRGGTLGEPVLIADLGGDDLDLTSGGAACPLRISNAIGCNGLAVQLRVDLGGSDTYRHSGNHTVAQGSGALGGLGILVDVAGDDTYWVEQKAIHGPFLLYYINGVFQGSGEGGVGLLLDLDGADRYEAVGSSPFHELFLQGQGFAGVGGAGALLDAAGDDVYDARARCTGNRGQFCGLYVQATAIYPGVAVQYDQAGDDAYAGVVVGPQMDYYSQSFAAFGGLAVQVDAAGHDTYLASGTSTNPNLPQTLNCAFASAMYGGAVAVFIDGAGNDAYVAETISPNPPHTMAEGFGLAGVALYWDVAGDDSHVMRNVGPNGIYAGRGTGSSPLEVAAVYLDTGGSDTYAPALGGDGQVWTLGADLNLVP